MKIHPLWIVCIAMRIMLIYLIQNEYPHVNAMLAIMGFGFIYNGYYGSNNEIQISKVFWHETRYTHGLLFLLASYYAYQKNSKMASLICSIDILFSFMYRFFSNH